MHICIQHIRAVNSLVCCWESGKTKWDFGTVSIFQGYGTLRIKNFEDLYDAAKTTSERLGFEK